nr:hypothetical protein Iba_scaffold30744CG0010 [Ipomoea batatas]
MGFNKALKQHLPHWSHYSLNLYNFLINMKMKLKTRVNFLVQYFHNCVSQIKKYLLPKHNNTPSCHVLTTMVSSAFYNCLSKRISNSKTFPCSPSYKYLATGCSIQACITHYSGILWTKPSIFNRSDDNFSTSHTLLIKVISFSYKTDVHSRCQKTTK